MYSDIARCPHCDASGFEDDETLDEHLQLVHGDRLDDERAGGDEA